MSWGNLGTFSPVLDQWRFADIHDVGGEVFRITQHNSEYVPRGFAWLSFLYIFREEPLYYRFHKIYPDWRNPGALIIVSPIPRQFLELGISARLPAMKLHYRSIWTDPSWELSLEVWNGGIDANTPEDILVEVNAKLDILLEQ